MSTRKRALRLPAQFLFGLLLVAFLPPPTSTAEGGTPTLTLNGVEYLHRWSGGDHHEFTPEGQEDLAQWQDMVTIVDYPDVRTGERLADVANQVLGLYQSQGKVLKTYSVPRTETAEAEHFVAAVLGTPDYLEAVMARYRISDGVGMVVISAHRVYGTAAGDPMSLWLREHGQAAEDALMSWDPSGMMAGLRAGALLLPPSTATQRTHQGHEVVEMPFVIAGGETIGIEVTDAGPIPAESHAFKIEVAGLSMQPSLFEPDQGLVAWQFALTAKRARRLERVVVEEVYPSDVARPIVDDTSPALEGKAWFGSGVGELPSPESTPWLYDGETSVYIYRFTVTAAGKKPVVLYQPSLITPDLKQQILQVAANIGKS